MADASSTHTEKAYAWGGEAPPSASVKVPIALPGLSGTAGRRYTPYSCLHRPLAEAGSQRGTAGAVRSSHLRENRELPTIA